MQPNSAILKVNNLIAGQNGFVLASNICFELKSGQILWIVGHNGTGKTTVFKALSGQSDYKGSILINEKELRSYNKSSLPFVLAWLGQHNPTDINISVLELVLSGAYHRKSFFSNYTAEENIEALAFLNQFGLYNRQNQNFSSLSGGQKQLAWIAQISMQNAPLILLDEPTQHLDIANKYLIFTQIIDLAATGKAIVCITHELETLRELEHENTFLLDISGPNSSPEPATKKHINQIIEKLRQTIF